MKVRRNMASLLIILLVMLGVLVTGSHQRELMVFAFGHGTPAFSHVSGDIRLQVERITLHRYFNIYSYVYGDRSHMEVELILEHLEQVFLPKGEIEVTLLDDQNNKIYPVPHLILRDFPEDHPLGYKLSLIARFPVPNQGVATVDINVLYMGASFRIESVPIH